MPPFTRIAGGVIKSCMISGALALLGWVFLPYYRGRLGRTEYVVLAWVVLIVIFTAMPYALKNQIYDVLKDGLAIVSHDVATVHPGESLNVPSGEKVLSGEHTNFFSIMHFLFFALTTFFVLMSLPYRSVALKLYDLFTLAVMTECTQVFVRDRGASVVDVGVDMAGVLMALTGRYLWARIYQPVHNMT